MKRLVALLMAAVVLTGCSTGSDAVAQGGSFEFVAPGGKTDIVYDPPTERGTPGPVSGPDLMDTGKTLSLSDFDGKVVVLNVWGQWCGPCRTEITELEKVYLATKDRGVAFLGIDVRDNNIVETPVMPGDAGSPTIELPTLEGWEDMGSNAPEGSYSASVFTSDPPVADPATVVTKVIKLTGNVDPAKVLEVAPGELRTLPGFDGPGAGQPNKLSGFDATVIGGTYTKDGAQRMVAQKTVVIPGQEGLYVLQINAEGTPDEANALMDATAAIDDQAKITP